MKRLLVGGLGLSLAWMGIAAAGDDGPWRPASASPALVKPSSALPSPGPSATLGRPVPSGADEALAAGGAARMDPAVSPASYSLPTIPLQPAVVRAQSSDVTRFASADSAPAKLAFTAPGEGRGSLFATGATGEADTGSVFAEELQAPALPGPLPASPAPTPLPPPRAVPEPGLRSNPEVIGLPQHGPASILAPTAEGVDAYADPGFSDEYRSSPPSSSFYVRAEYLLWWIKAPDVPPLATTGPFDPVNNLAGSNGFLGAPGVRVLFGGNAPGYGAFNGGRITAGYWFEPDQRWGIEASFFQLAQNSIKFSANSGQFPVIARPFFDANDGTQFSELVAQPGKGAGTLTIQAPSRLWGAEANLRCNVCCDCGFKLGLLGGFRMLDLDESITITERSVAAVAIGGFPAGTADMVTDNFHTRNQFYGGQLGADAEWHWGPWSLDLIGKLAAGINHETINIQGGQMFVLPTGTVAAFNGGLLALPSNIGIHQRSSFAVVPEVNLNLGYQITESLKVFVGYDFLWWSNVVRPGDQIDTTLNINQIPNFVKSPNPGPNRPLVPFKTSDFWAQGMNVGLEYRY